MSNRILVFLSGYPGTGKTYFADALITSIRNAGNCPVRKFCIPMQRWQTRPFILIYCCLRHFCLLICVAKLIQSLKDTSKIAGIAQNFRDAARIIFSHNSLFSLNNLPGKEIIFVDEPPWHLLWTKTFPTESIPPQNLLEYVIQKMTKNYKKAVFISFSLSKDDCIEKFKNRISKKSRFSTNSPEHIIKYLKKDKIYQTMKNLIKLSAAEDALFIENIEKLSKEDVQNILIEYAGY